MRCRSCPGGRWDGFPPWRMIAVPGGCGRRLTPASCRATRSVVNGTVQLAQPAAKLRPPHSTRWLGRGAQEDDALGLEMGPPAPRALVATRTVHHPAAAAEDSMGVGKIRVRHEPCNLPRCLATACGRGAEVAIRRPLTGIDEAAGEQDPPGNVARLRRRSASRDDR